MPTLDFLNIPQHACADISRIAFIGIVAAAVLAIRWTTAMKLFQRSTRSLQRKSKGNIMASNPEWCMTLDEWRAQFSKWIRTPEPVALLNATIFFDFRPLYGKVELSDAMRRHLLSHASATPIFLQAMARNALQVGPA